MVDLSLRHPAGVSHDYQQDVPNNYLIHIASKRFYGAGVEQAAKDLHPAINTYRLAAGKLLSVEVELWDRWHARWEVS